VLPASAVWALLPLHARVTLGLGATGYGALLGCFGVGAVLAGLALPYARARFGPEGLATGGAFVFAIATAVLGIVPTTADRALLLGGNGIALFAAGGAWLALLSTLNAVAQSVIPPWVRARALATYLLVLFGGLAAGSALFGALAEAVGVSMSFAIAGAAIAIGRLAIWQRRLPSGDGPDLSPAPRRPDPQSELAIEGDRGPVLVTVEYAIDPADATAFARAMRELSEIRLRDGALRWGLWADTTQAGRYLESFVVESWLEHLRQHERMTAADRAVPRVAHVFHRGGEPPRVTHFVHETIPPEP
jgi:MFS family permease